MKNDIGNMESSRIESPDFLVHGKTQPKEWPVEGPAKTTEVLGEGYSRVKILQCCPQTQDRSVLLDLIYVIVDEWGIDRSSVQKKHPKRANHRKD
jgi:hypothetical protein